ncbi:hypothetical protein [Jannaschia aquimarina]|uniref:Uncharacterized protein n=1 Tax=Jannaschia aquimarina TaxID=935700 RepID=A0A0D1D3Q5_9RHOB|nr:hypothetical protein [Jannaschia aquimarina]KIT14733.1 hypothetical protein jaqu_35360 [Jannaschia aquimarina]SNS76711.1 hypothetical protein SAMN05421775_102209 [Jannaschia aquimarina]
MTPFQLLLIRSAFLPAGLALEATARITSLWAAQANIGIATGEAGRTLARSAAESWTDGARRGG